MMAINIKRGGKQYLRAYPRFIWDMVDSFLIWLNKIGYYSYDQYDFWSTGYGRFSKDVYYKNQIFGIPLVIPIFLLELFIPHSRVIFTHKKRFPIADAHFILGYINLFKIKKKDEFLNEAIKVSDELIKTAVSGYSGYCWGYPFNWQTSLGLSKKGTPLITTVPYCFEAFLSLYDVTKEQKYLDVAYSISKFVSEDINDNPVSKLSSACSYSPLDNSMVINANAYRGFLLMEAYHRYGVYEFKEKAVRNINFVLENQNSDGSWLYAANNPNDAFVDNFHTCFILKNLYKANARLRGQDIHNAITKGYSFYRKNLFTNNAIPKPYAILKRFQLVQIEIYDYAEGISLGVLLKNEIPGAFEIAKKLARDVYLFYKLPDGHFTTRVYKYKLHNTVPYLRWPQAQMFFALTMLLSNAEND